MTTEVNPTATPAVNQAPLNSSLPVEGSQATPTILAEAALSSEPAKPADPAAPAVPPVAKPADPAAPAGEQVLYELELSDSSPLSDNEFAEITDLAGRLNLSKEDAEKLIAFKEASYKNGKTAAESASQAKINIEREKILKDPDFMGDKKAETFTSIHRAVKAFGDADLSQALLSPEIGYSLPLAKFLKKVGDALGPDTIQGKGAVLTKPENTESAKLEKMYPAFYPQKN